MPQTVPCPNGDKGICTIPDQTAVVVAGRVQVRTRREIERVFPDLDLETAQLRPIELSDEAEVAGAGTGGGGSGERSSSLDIDKGSSSGSARAGDDLLEAFVQMERTGRLRENARRVILEAASGSSSGGGVVVRCSCGDYFIADG